MTFLGFDWQKVAVALIVSAAAVYFLLRALARLRSFGAGAKRGAPACGNCEQNERPRAQAAKVLVQIAPSKNVRRGRDG
ncbi:MAG TPA: hypothetical protein VER32_04575 [Pyrinomonadaceae bacterium]|nr:hypothetical protein [Pyrinomonadaceae bacterium]